MHSLQSENSVGELTLAIDTATRRGGVALLRGADALVEITNSDETTHSEWLLAAIAEAVAHVAGDLSDVGLIGIASGPGSFTGLRIGLASAKALAATAQIRCAGVPTMHAVALCAQPYDHVLALLPAGRNELFAQSFVRGVDGRLSETSAAVCRPLADILKAEQGNRLSIAAPDALGLHADLAECALDLGVELVIGEHSGSVGMHSWLLAAAPQSLARLIGTLAQHQLPVSTVWQSAAALAAIYVRKSDGV